MKRYVSKFKNSFKEDKFQYLTDEAIKSVDTKALESEISSMLKIPVTIKLSIAGLSNRLRIEGESQEIVNKTGIFKAVLKTCKVETFNTDMSSEEDGVWWATWSLRYQNKDGGSNGMTFLNSWYNFNTKKWIFRSR